MARCKAHRAAPINLALIKDLAVVLISRHDLWWLSVDAGVCLHCLALLALLQLLCLDGGLCRSLLLPLSQRPRSLARLKLVAFLDCCRALLRLFTRASLLAAQGPLAASDAHSSPPHFITSFHQPSWLQVQDASSRCASDKLATSTQSCWTQLSRSPSSIIAEAELHGEQS